MGVLDSVIKGVLIGDPVTFSISDKIYPRLFNEYAINGEFTKVQVKDFELVSFFKDPQYDFITVTMPHKLSVIPFCSSLSDDAKAIGSVNYILCLGNELIGQNFDGVGCLNEIEKKILVKDKRVLVIGTGGAGRAAIYEAKKRGARVFCSNRSIEKGQKVADEFGVYFLNNIEDGFDVVINATSIGMDPSDERLVVKEEVLKEAVVLDMASRDGNCKLNTLSVKNKSEYISGKDMFLNLTRHAFLKFFVSMIGLNK